MNERINEWLDGWMDDVCMYVCNVMSVCMYVMSCYVMLCSVM